MSEAVLDDKVNDEAEVDYEHLDAFGQSLAKTRAEAINARQSSGIEEIWAEDEAFYEGIDEANAGSEKFIYRQKPPGRSAPQSSSSVRSTVFPNITGPFVDSAAARIADMLLPTDDRAWSYKPTPIPELWELAEGNIPPTVQQDIGQKYPNQVQANQAKTQAVQQAQEQVDIANKKAKAAEKRVDDWHTECQYHSHVRTVIEDSARIGTGILKGPVPKRKRAVKWAQTEEGGEITIMDKIIPASKWLDPWNFFPDGSCGENIHNGSYTWEREYFTRKQLRDLMGQMGYLDKQIERCLKEGPQTATSEYREYPNPDVNEDPSHKNRFDVWYYYGTAEREDIEAAGCECEEGEFIPVMVTMVNNHVIRVSLNPLDTGEFPYDVMVWRRRAGHWAGIGVARQIRVPQKIVTGGTRNLMDNAGIAAGPMLILKQGKVYPADNSVVGFAPRKVYYVAENDNVIDDVRKAMGTVKVDMMVNELMAIIQFGLQLAESVTNMPLILQGQMGQSVPETLGGQQLFQNNASTVLRRLAKLFDDRVTEPQLRRWYHWVLQYSDNEEEKGDFIIDARGSSALVEREIQNQELVQLLGLFQNPIYKKDPARGMDEYLKSRHFDPKRFDYEDEEWEQIVQNLSQPQDQRLAIEELKAKVKGLEMDWKTGEAEKDRQHKSFENELDRGLEIILNNVKTEVDALNKELEQAGREQISLDKLKAALTQASIKSMDENRKMALQRDLANQTQVMTPPTEPPGRAQEGRAFQQ